MAGSRYSASCSFYQLYFRHLYVGALQRAVPFSEHWEESKEVIGFYWLDTDDLKEQRRKKNHQKTNNAHAAHKELSQRHWKD